MTSRGCSHCFVVVVVVVVVVLSIFLKLIVNYRLCVVGFTFTASLMEKGYGN